LQVNNSKQDWQQMHHQNPLQNNISVVALLFATMIREQTVLLKHLKLPSLTLYLASVFDTPVQWLNRCESAPKFRGARKKLVLFTALNKSSIERFGYISLRYS
jgi:hypothetical protein